MCECEWDVTESGVGREYSEVLSKKKTVEDVQFDLLQVKRKEKKKNIRELSEMHMVVKIYTHDE